MRLSVLFLLMVGSIFSVSQTPDLVKTDQPASVTGSVLNSVTGAPLGHAHVKFSDFSRRRSYGAVTDADGTFSISSIAAGSYNTSVEKNGYLPPPHNDNSMAEAVVELTPGQHLTNIQFRMVPPSVISGHVVDRNNDPVENMAVEAHRGNIAATAITNDRGEFRIYGLQAGRYLIRASGLSGARLPPEIRTDGTREANYGPTFYPGTIDRVSATPVQARRGSETAGIDIRLAEIPVLRVTGTVLGVPMNAQGLGLSIRNGQSSQSHPVTADHRFAIWRLPPGTYWLSAQCQDISGKLFQSAEFKVELSNKNVDNVELTITPAFDLTGEIVGHRPESSNSTVRRPKLQLVLGQGLADVPANGKFTIKDMRPGRYRVTINGLSSDEYVKEIRIGLSDFPGRFVDLRSGPPKGPVELIIGHGTAAIEGKVRDSQQRPVAAMVALLIDDEYGDEQPTMVFSNANGEFSFTNVAPGSYKLVALHRDDMAVLYSGGRELYENLMQKIEVSEGDKATQELTLVGFDE